jgi:hypothetical protein
MVTESSLVGLMFSSIDGSLTDACGRRMVGELAEELDAILAEIGRNGPTRTR